MSLPAQVLFPDGPDRRPQPDHSPRGRTSGTLIDASLDADLEFLRQGGMLSAMAEVVMNSVGANGLCVAYANEGAVVCRASCGDIAPAVGTPLNLNSGIGAQCLREGKTVTCRDTDTDSRVNREVCHRIGVRSILAVPLKLDSRVIGIAQAFYAQPNGFSEANVLELEQSARILVSILPVNSASKETGKISQPCLDPPLEVTSSAAKISAETVNADASIVEAYSPLDSAQCSPHQVPDQESPSEPQQISDAAQLPMQPVADYLPMHQTSGQSVRESVAEVIHPFDLGQKEVEDQIVVPPFAQIEEPVWWKRATVVAAAISILCVLFWVIARGSSGNVVASPQTEIAASAETSDAGDMPQLPHLPVAQLLQRAQTGDTRAQFALAKRYETGKGIARNLTKAYSWYIIATEAGNDAARQAIRPLTSKLTAAQIAAVRFEVARMYANGVGVRRRDPVAAYAWMVLAEAAGDRRAKTEQNRLAASMRPQEIAEAQTRASYWLRARGYSTQYSQ